MQPKIVQPLKTASELYLET